MYIEISKIKKRLKRLVWRYFNQLENNGNANFYQNGEYVFIKNLLQGFKDKNLNPVTFFDVGANIGDYTAMIMKETDELNLNVLAHLFEPTIACSSLLGERFKDKTNVFLNQSGVSNKAAQAEIFYNAETSGLASLYQRNLDSYQIQLNHSETIQLIRLDDYINKNNVKHIHFIKVDIEGHELKAFEGLGEYLNSDFIDYIQFEYGGANLDSHSSLMEIYQLLEACGFAVAKIMPTGLEIRKYAPFMDNFNYANYVAISKKVLAL